jgi:hypothetical protein
MSTVNGNYYGGIVKDGLVLLLDAAKRDSYPRVGTAWTDLSRNGNNGTLTNFSSPSPQTIWNGDNGGSIVFDGTNDYGVGTYNSTLNLSTNNFTLEGWFNSTSFATGQVLISKDTYGTNYDWSIYIPSSTSIALYSNGTTTNVTATVPTMSINTWYHISITSVGGTINIYLNGVLYKTQSMSVSNNSQSYFTIGCSIWNNPNSFIKGKISVLRIYSKGLSSSEILQNYNALKERYNNLWKDSYLWLDTDVWKDQII